MSRAIAPGSFFLDYSVGFDVSREDLHAVVALGWRGLPDFGSFEVPDDGHASFEVGRGWEIQGGEVSRPGLKDYAAVRSVVVPLGYEYAAAKCSVVGAIILEDVGDLWREFE